MNNENRHTFACFFNEEYASLLKDVLTVADKPLYQRVTSILRLRFGDSLILFSIKHVYTGILGPDKKNMLVLTNVKKESIAPLQPSLSLVLPLLKKGSFEEALYSAAQMGVTEIIPFKPQKSQYKADFEDERERMSAIMVAACEQAKQFAIPALKSPVSVESAALVHADHKYLCDVDGGHLSQVLGAPSKQSLALAMGPEGGLTDAERDIFIQNGWKSVLFTPSILRSIDMVMIGLGVLRSWMR